MVKKAFYLNLKALFVLDILQFMFLIFSQVGKRPDKKAKMNFKLYDVTKWITNSYNTHIAQYLQT